MSTNAYILIETAVGKTREVAVALRELGGTYTVDVVTGPYDIIAVIDATDISVIGSLVTDKIHTLGGVVRTVTCLGVGG